MVSLIFVDFVVVGNMAAGFLSPSLCNCLARLRSSARRFAAANTSALDFGAATAADFVLCSMLLSAASDVDGEEDSIAVELFKLSLLLL